MEFENTIGLETHVQLKTRTKMFCGCLLKTGCEPNTNVCPVCLGYPGALPVANKEAIKLTVMSGLMLGCEINRHATFDRKNYFYPDMAKDYQISENGNPLCLGGGVTIETPNGPKTIRINHIHLEEDAAKINHYAQTSGVDFNRGGTPLMEIVSEPDMASADEAIAYLTALKEMLVYAGVSDCNLEEGNMRSDVNISIRPVGETKLGTKVEIKNMNSFRGIHAALEYEARRQRECMAHSIPIVQETRRWDGEALETASMRTKENAHDYRYFPEPDLVPVALSDEQIEEWRKLLPEKPEARRARMIEEYGIAEYDAGVLSQAKANADFFEAAAKGLDKKIAKQLCNLYMSDVMALLNESGKEIGAHESTRLEGTQEDAHRVRMLRDHLRHETAVRAVGEVGEHPVVDADARIGRNEWRERACEASLADRPGERLAERADRHAAQRCQPQLAHRPPVTAQQASWRRAGRRSSGRPCPSRASSPDPRRIRRRPSCRP